MTDETTKTVISITKPSPQWANYSFRAVFILTLAVGMYISGDSSIPDDVKVRVLNAMKVLDFLVWAFSRMLGVEIKADDYKR